MTGLTSAEAATRLAELGPNEVPSAPPVPLVRRILAQLADPMILLLIGAFVVVFVIGDVADAVIISAVVVLNTAIGVVQEVRAANAIAALEQVSAPRARVRRDGRWEEVSSRLVVMDDVVRLEAGDVVPADLRLVEAVSLDVDEASMTGESLPVSRREGDELLSGVVVTHGRGMGVVVRTGAQSGLGRIAALIAQTRLRSTPLQQRLARLSRQLVTVTAGLALLVVVLGVARGDGVTDALILAVSLGVAAVPESLPAVVSVALAMGAHRMAKRSALVRWLPAVETLGSVTVLASDKTGTLTEGRMTVQRAWTPLGMSTVTGRGYEVAGDIVGPSAAQAARLMRDLALCNEARIFRDGPDDWRIVGDPMEAALLVAAAKGGVEQPALRDAWTRVDEIPFDSESQRMTTVDRRDDGCLLEVVKGAPEVVLDLAAGSSDVHEARRVAHELADSGYRVLAVVDRLQRARDEGADGVASGDAVVHELVGLVGIVDPLRAEAPDVVRACQEAGIRTILITGDHPATARAIAVEVGIAGEGALVVSGDAVARGDHVEQVESIAVYARTRPEQKVDIIDAWQARGHVVAMTGDGVNDAPALRRADLGVAMGDRGTEVARQAADLVLADDQLRTVVHAVEEGRRIYSNIRGFLRYALAGGLAEVGVILLGPFVGLGFPPRARPDPLDQHAHPRRARCRLRQRTARPAHHAPAQSLARAVGPGGWPGAPDPGRRVDDRGGEPRGRTARLVPWRVDPDLGVPLPRSRPARPGTGPPGPAPRAGLAQPRPGGGGRHGGRPPTGSSDVVAAAGPARDARRRGRRPRPADRSRRRAGCGDRAPGSAPPPTGAASGALTAARSRAVRPLLGGTDAPAATELLGPDSQPHDPGGQPWLGTTSGARDARDALCLPLPWSSSGRPGPSRAAASCSRTVAYDCSSTRASTKDSPSCAVVTGSRSRWTRAASPRWS